MREKYYMGAGKGLSYLFVGVSLILPFEYVSHCRNQFPLFFVGCQKKKIA